MTDYQDDILACNQIAQTSPATLKRAALFVLATIQQQLETVPGIVADFVALETASRFAFGSKKAGIKYLNKNAAELYRDAMAARGDDAALMAVFLAVPGFGLVKAGFMCSLFAGSVGCIDSHNVKLYGIKLSALRYTAKAKQQTRDAKIDQYIQLCAGLGGAVNLWTRWCDYVAKLRPNNWASGAVVSSFHVDILAGIETGQRVDLFSDLDYDPEFLRGAA